MSASPSSHDLAQRAKAAMPGGVNSPVRAFTSVGGEPIFAKRAQGARLQTEDGRWLIDFCMSFGPLVLGHAHPDVVRAATEAVAAGTSYAVTTRAEIEVAELIQSAIPSMERIRLVSSGTEACMTAIRLARGVTGRDKVLKFSGCYHGHADSFLVKAGSGVVTLGIPGSPGVPEEIVKNTISIPYNNQEILEKTLRDNNLDIACVIVEPVAGNMGCVAPASGFLEKLRSLTKELGIVLIFDEVITGFRLSYGGAQQYYNIDPDLTCLGKIIVGGLPVGAYGGKAEIMNCIAPDGPVYQAGTLSGNPLAMAAGIAALKLLQKPGFYEQLNNKAAGFAEQLAAVAKSTGMTTQLNRAGSLMTCFFTEHEVTDFDSAFTADTDRYAQHYRQMLSKGIYLAPSQFEVAFISTAQSEEDLEKATKMTEWSFKKLLEK